ncbi:MvaI/BcnI family restriction endonuclease [Aliarcobacter butzleri]|uniref:MvaI/BcnI family restriction endonuclease n=1 Tax=Aliarcobacter butzleri TaxID=28197 RepID=UPI0021B2FDE1|nr:MvaI/BcnI family restriction endonuclease [Aliarcobacter butzleri]MCT7581446.1 MvaI/BcnI family restriction endonuclease [Aliarcobacter butzleri]
MRKLTNEEISKVKELSNNSIPFTLIEPTKTALEKSIIDATAPVRLFLQEQNIHDYNSQQQGPENKINIEETFILTKDEQIKSNTSLYRPNTKKGDPRIWFKNLPKYSNANDIFAITYLDSYIYLFNITQLDILEILKGEDSPIKKLAKSFLDNSNNIADELLGKLREIVREGAIKAIRTGDTAIGHAIESALGIEQNSSKKPDYKGIELKSSRAQKITRKNLFAQVSDWGKSKFKSSEEILNNFGYHRGSDFKLYCTVSSKVINSQGLSLKTNLEKDLLIEYSNKPEIGEFAVWTLTNLKSRLLEKHNETFWIDAESELIDGIEHFHLKKVLYTKKPDSYIFQLLLEQGEITIDHLIKKNEHGKVIEKGPLFKISKKGFTVLFPEPIEYNLN